MCFIELLMSDFTMEYWESILNDPYSVLNESNILDVSSAENTNILPATFYTP
jgi:hypothetical protein